MCKSKLHCIRVTGKNTDYNGSIGIDKKILDAGNIYANEMVLIANVTNGNRFETYCIPEEEESGKVVLYGGTAKLGEIGHTLIVISSALIQEKDASSFHPRIIKVDKDNKIK